MKPADAQHRLGYGRAGYIWSMFAAFGLFTVGSVVSIWHGVSSLGGEAEATSYGWAYAVLLAAGLVFGVWLCGKVARDLGVHDHEGIVWDEMVGMWITLWLVPEGWWWLLIGFVVFRIVDILKPWPISWVDRNVHGGVGIMLDDVLAGVFAWLVMQGLVWGWVHWLV